MSDQDIMEQMQKSSSAKRYRPEGTSTNGTQQQMVVRARASRTAEQPLLTRSGRKQDTTSRQRKTADYPEPKTDAPRRVTQAYQVPDTEADIEVAPTVRPRSANAAAPTRQLPSLRQGPYAQGHTKGITIGVGVAIGVMWLAWFLSTSGASFWATHVTDPGTYGPMHGNVVTGVFGGGDSIAHPTKLIALNNGGRVEIIKITAGNPQKTQIISGPDLVASSFPDAAQAEIELRVDGPTVTVTIYGSAFVVPFHRYSQFVVLHSDGKGNLKGGQ